MRPSCCCAPRDRGPSCGSGGPPTRTGWICGWGWRTCPVTWRSRTLSAPSTRSRCGGRHRTCRCGCRWVSWAWWACAARGATTSPTGWRPRRRCCTRRPSCRWCSWWSRRAARIARGAGPGRGGCPTCATWRAWAPGRAWGWTMRRSPGASTRSPSWWSAGWTRISGAPPRGRSSRSSWCSTAPGACVCARASSPCCAGGRPRGCAWCASTGIARRCQRSAAPWSPLRWGRRACRRRMWTRSSG